MKSPEGKAQPGSRAQCSGKQVLHTGVLLGSPPYCFVTLILLATLESDDLQVCISIPGYFYLESVSYIEMSVANHCVNITQASPMPRVQNGIPQSPPPPQTCVHAVIHIPSPLTVQARSLGVILPSPLFFTGHNRSSRFPNFDTAVFL